MAKKSSTAALLVDREPQVKIKSVGHQKLKITLNEMITVEPLTRNQEYFFDLYRQDTQCILLHGVAGTGKTFIALYRALEEALDLL